MTDDICRFIVFDFDNHEKDAGLNDFANTDELWTEENSYIAAEDKDIFENDSEKAYIMGADKRIES